MGLPFQHVTAKEYIATLGQQAWNESFKFTVLRNPWDKVVSHYHYRVMTDQTDLGSRTLEFGEWVKRTYGEQDPEFYDIPKMFMPQTDWITDNDGNISTDLYLRFENLEADFYGFCRTYQISARPLPHLKASKRGKYQLYYSPETIDIVENWFKPDIENFGYRFE